MSHIRGIVSANRRILSAMFAVIVVLHLLGWGLLFSVVSAGTAAISLGIGVTAYILGVRHAFDADHIAAIDNTTRKLASDSVGRTRPVSVGFWFSLGHSSVVFGICIALAFGVKSVARAITDDTSTLHTVTSTIGPTVSGLFLYALASINAVLLLRIVALFRQMRAGNDITGTLDHHLNRRGLFARLLTKVTRFIRRPRDMYPTGLLFGLGFDTATEVSLLVLAGGAAVTLPWYAVLPLPLLFAAGMCLFDTIDGAFMNVAYDWANTTPTRKIYYNGVITLLSVAIAGIVGTVQLATVAAARLHITSGPVAALANFNMDNVGYSILVLFLGTWLLAMVAWKALNLDERYPYGALANPGGSR